MFGGIYMKFNLALIEWEDQHFMTTIKGTSAGIIVEESKNEIVLTSDKLNNGNRSETIYPKNTITKIRRRTIEL